MDAPLPEGTERTHLSQPGSTSQTSAAQGITAQERLYTYDFPLVQVILLFSPVALEPRAHIHTGSDHRDSFVESFGHERVVHHAFCYGFLLFDITLSQELVKVGG